MKFRVYEVVKILIAILRPRGMEF